MEKDEDVNEFRVAVEYLNIEDWERIPRSLKLKESIIEDVKEKYGRSVFKERVYQSLLQWKMYRPETSNIEELIKALKEDDLNGPALEIKKAINSYRNDRKAKPVEEPVEVPVVETTFESVSTKVIGKEIKKIKTSNSNVKHVSFSRDGLWFSSVGKGNFIEIWEWTSLTRKFQRELAKPEAYAAYFNDGVIDDKSLCISVGTKKEMFIYKIKDEMPLVCRIDCDESVTYGSWFKRDEFMSGSAESAGKHLWLNFIIDRGSASEYAGMAPKKRNILHRDDIQSATLFKTFQNKILLCFKRGRNLEIISDFEEGDGKALQQSSSQVFNRIMKEINLFVLMEKGAKDILRFLKIELVDLKYIATYFDVHVQGTHEYCDFTVTGDNVIIGSASRVENYKCFFVCNIQNKLCEQKLEHKSKVCSVACHPTEPKAVITSDRGGNVFVWNLNNKIIK